MTRLRLKTRYRVMGSERRWASRPIVSHFAQRGDQRSATPARSGWRAPKKSGAQTAGAVRAPDPAARIVARSARAGPSHDRRRAEAQQPAETQGASRGFPQSGFMKASEAAASGSCRLRLAVTRRGPLLLWPGPPHEAPPHQDGPPPISGHFFVLGGHENTGLIAPLERARCRTRRLRQVPSQSEPRKHEAFLQQNGPIQDAN